MLIESPRNETLKTIRRLRRCKGDHALLEGHHLVEEALDAGFRLRSVLMTPEVRTSAVGQRIEVRLPFPPLEVLPALLQSLADADSPRGLLALVDLPRGGVEALPAERPGCFLYLDGLQDPGNLGALARVAEAAGAAGLALSPGTVHPNHPRALRASAGSLLRLPVAREVVLDELRRHLAALEPRWLALATREGEDLFRTHLTGSAVLLLGAEGPGLSAQTEAFAESHLTIPLEPPVESLNVTVAAALALFEMRRQRLAGQECPAGQSPVAPTVP